MKQGGLRPLWQHVTMDELWIDTNWIQWTKDEPGTPEVWVIGVDGDGVAWTYCLSD